MSLKIKADTDFKLKPSEDQKGKDHIARRAGKKHVLENTYKNRTLWNRVCDSIGASKGANVMAKAVIESHQYVQAAVLRKTADAESLPNPHENFDAKVWNSKGVAQRVMREDHVRFNKTHFSKRNQPCLRNRFAHALSRVAHLNHGICEMFSAPTGMSNNVLKNLVSAKVDEKSAKNRAYMTVFLPFIGAGTATGLAAAVATTGDTLTLAGQLITGVILAFPILSSFFGLFGTLFAFGSQIVIKKQDITDNQKEEIEKGLNSNLQRLVHRIKSIDNNPELIRLLAKAMQGKAFMNKFDSISKDEQGIPHILRQAIDVVKPEKSDDDNMLALKNQLGKYLHVDKPLGTNKGLLARYQYARAVRFKEEHYVALMSLVDHADIRNDHEAELLDARKWVEDKGAPALHDLVLNVLAHPASVIDAVAKTKIAPTLRKWADKKYRERQAEKLKDPSRASKNKTNVEYMFKNRHQYGRITRGLMLLAEAVRLINIGIVLSSNGQLSRIFSNLAIGIHKKVATNPASRSIYNSIGRFLGGATLAVIFGVFAGVATPPDGGNSAATFNIPLSDQLRPVTISFLNVGILMFLLAFPTYLAQKLVEKSAELEGWKGNISKQLPPVDQRLNWGGKA